MVLPVVGQPTDAVVTVAQDLNPQLVVFLKGQGVDWGPEAPASSVRRGERRRSLRKAGWEEVVGASKKGGEVGPGLAGDPRPPPWKAS